MAKTMVDKVAEIGILGGVAFVGYKVLQGGAFGTTLQGLTDVIQCVFNKEKCKLLPGTTPPGTKPPGTIPPTPGRCNGTGDWGWMVASDPNIAQHIDEWQAAVGSSRKYNWNEFRPHEMAITGLASGGFDPGSEPPAYFCR